MHHLLRVVGLVALVGGFMLFWHPAQVLADCSGGDAFPDTVSQAQGHTFDGVFDGVTGDFFNPVQHWTVEHAYAGDVTLGKYSYPAYSCHEIHFTTGRRYLVSTARFDAWTTAAYRMLGGGKIQLIGFEGVSPSQYPKGLQVNELADALAVLVLPSSDATAADADPAPTAWLTLSVLGLGTLLVFGLCGPTRFRRRQGQPTA
jgi:hypothetical protein